MKRVAIFAARFFFTDAFLLNFWNVFNKYL